MVTGGVEDKFEHNPLSRNHIRLSDINRRLLANPRCVKARRHNAAGINQPDNS